MDRFASLVEHNDPRFFELAAGIIFDEGSLVNLLISTGKNGNSEMLQFLMSHGAENIDDALASAIFYHQNEFARKWISDKITNVDYLLQSAIDGDNLEMMKMVIIRSIDPNVKRLRTNQTSAWFTYFKGLSPDAPVFWSMGFAPSDKVNHIGHINTQDVYQAMRSELIEPLPYTYDNIKRLRISYINLARHQVEALVSRNSRNYGRLAWIVDAALRDGRDTTPESVPFWINALLPMIGDPNAIQTVSKARQFLGEEWAMLLDPIRSDEQIEFVLQFIEPARREVKGFFPIQYEVIDKWVDRCVDGVDSDGVPNIRPDSLYIGLEWITSNYPNGKRTIKLGRVPARKYDGYDFHRAISKMFDKHPLLTLESVLRHRLLDVWNELSQRVDPGELRGYGMANLVSGAADGGVNQVCEALSQITDQPVIPSQWSYQYPRIIRFLGARDINRIKPIVPNSAKAIALADQIFLKNQRLIQERLRFLSA